MWTRRPASPEELSDMPRPLHRKMWGKGCHETNARPIYRSLHWIALASRGQTGNTARVVNSAVESLRRDTRSAISPDHTPASGQEEILRYHPRSRRLEATSRSSRKPMPSNLTPAQPHGSPCGNFEPTSPLHHHIMLSNAAPRQNPAKRFRRNPM